ncbi:MULTISPECIES: TIGR04255 family protein [Arthrobacter]|uniref:Uncharacterized protein (TIGR04255 family) n=1 Tax=Arthrobacter bambusae TaxID=1338426 RepID=A0AAW8DEK2_9MICC|nr:MULTISPECIES: TIGR04255 family protein [Arthrobacter]MDP9907256.1 uncharacterized protein (TIGR04255 family) [Arthrobacter bambusae]MDQ0131393.1 uncharacterized protein (TIGR04255 family) [Arthrobacter bambusae]MDQ0182726.1 uncharacterized protein (TIGR04255 family) [Arthrobacter bambusae]
MSEVFPSAPLAMVVAEIRFGYSPALEDRTIQSNVLMALSSYAPVLKRNIQESHTIEIGGPEPVHGKQTIEVMEATAVDGQTTIAISAETLTIAMSGLAYRHYEESLRPLIADAVHSLVATAPNLYVTRFGLRYLDEIRVPVPPPDVDGWGEWVTSDLLGGIGLLGIEAPGAAKGMRSTWHYVLPRERQVVLNLGPFFGTGVIGPGHPFHRDSEPEHMFVLDVDVSRTPTTPESLDAEMLLSNYDELHRPAHSVFSAALTDKARILFRGTK